MRHSQTEHAHSAEESASLKPRSGTSHSAHHSGSGKFVRSGSDGHGAGAGGASKSIRFLHQSREKRLESVRIHAIYYILWTLLILLSISIPFYEWFSINEPECWSARYGDIMASVFVSMLTIFVAALLCLLNCTSRVTISYWRLNFATLCFLLLVLLSIINFMLGIFLLSRTSCYLAQITPVDRLQRETFPEDSTFLALFKTISIKYDLKVAAILHLSCTVLSFSIGIAFAIIKNNFKYIRQIDFD